MATTLVGRERQSHRKCGADLRRAVDFDRTVVVFDDLFRDVETETSPALALLGCEVGVEDFGHLFLGHAGAAILDAKLDVKILLRASDRDRAFLFGAGLHRIDQDVLDRAIDLNRVPEKGAGIFTNR